MVLNLTVSFPGRDGHEAQLSGARYAYRILSMKSLKKVIQIPAKIYE